MTLTGSGGNATVDTNGNAVTLSGQLSGLGGLTKLGLGLLTLSATNTYAGSTQVNAGILTATTTAALPGFASAGTVSVAPGATLGIRVGGTGEWSQSSINALTNNATFAPGSLLGIDTTDATGSFTYANSIGGSIGVNKLGSGVLILCGTNAYSGPTVVSAGTLRLQSAATLPANTKIMPVGDSITYGVAGTNGGYRGFLYSDLTTSGNTIQFVGTTNGNAGSLPASPVNQQYHDGWSGWTTGDVLGTIQSSFNNGTSGNINTWLTSLTADGQAPTAITMMIGTNDPVRGGASGPPDVPATVSQATSNLSAIINVVYAKDPGVRLLVAMVTPRYDNSADNNWNNSYNAALPGLIAQKQAAGDNIALVDMNTNFPAGGLSSDNLHPNDTGYAWMATQWQNALLAGGVSAAIPGSSPTTVAAGAVLDINGCQTTIGPLSGAGSVALGSGGSLTINCTPGNSSTYTGSISGGGGVVKIGAASLMLAGNNTYTGATTVSAGTLQLGDGVANNGSVVGNITDNAVLAFANPYALTYGGAISGSGALMKSGPGRLVLTGNNSYSGGTTVSGGTLVVSSPTALGSGQSLVVQSAAVDFGTGPYFLQQGGECYVSGGGNLINCTQLAVGMTGFGSGSLTVDGSGSSLTAGALYLGGGGATGTATFSNGASGSLNLVALANDFVPGSSGSLSILSGANVNVAGNITVANQGADTSGQIIISGSNSQLAQTASGTLVSLGCAWASTGQATITVNNGGTFAPMGLTVAAGSAAIMLDGGTLKSLASFSIPAGSNFQLTAGPGGATFDTSGNTLSINAAISGPGSVTQTGSGQLVLAGTNTYAGGTTVISGTLNVTGASALPSSGVLVVGRSGRVVLGNSVSIAVPSSINGQWATNGGGVWSGTANWTGGNVPGTPQDTAVFGTVLTSGTAAVTLDSSRSLASLGFSATGANSYVISPSNGSTLTLANTAGSATISNSGGNNTIAAPITMGNNLSITASTGSVLTIASTIAESSSGTSLSFGGGGELILGGTNTYTGGTIVNGGTVSVTAASALPSAGVLVAGRSGRVVLGNSLGAAALVASSSPASDVISLATTPAVSGIDSSLAGQDSSPATQALVPVASPVSGEAAAVPEPGTLLLLLVAAVALAIGRRKT
jgi:autotransporter-associated beta strand protein